MPDWYFLPFALRCTIRSWGVGLRHVKRSIWVHGQTVEQFCAAEGLMRMVRHAAPQHHFVFTSPHLVTLEWLQSKFATDTVLFAPRGPTFVLRKFFHSLSPQLLILLESPDGLDEKVLRKAVQAQVPIVAVNVRADALSRLSGLTAPLSAPRISQICVQDELTAAVLRTQGFPEDRIAVTGNLHFEFAPPTRGASEEYLRQELGLAVDAPVLIAEKISAQEEVGLIELFWQLRSSHPSLVLLLEPRRRRQLRSLESLLRARHLPLERRSQGAKQATLAAILFDFPGELPGVYGVATCVLAGGSFAADGDALNFIGPASRGKPIIFGPHLSPDAEISNLLVRQHAALQVSPPTLVQALDALLCSATLRDTIGRRAACFARQHQGAYEKTYQVIERLIPKTENLPGQRTWRAKPMRERFGESALWRKVASFCMQGRIDDWGTLNNRLGHPRTILCLGNGPSSELPQLREIKHDCLMRVNWRWKERGFLAEPEVVFVGDVATLHKLSPCIFGFWSIRQELGWLLRHLLVRGPGTIEYFTMERISSLIRDQDWHARPTNGALMIVAAAALQPERLIIAGMDLFLHADGKYPGDLRSPNEYARVHSRNVDLKIMQTALKEYQGKLVILSEALRQSLAEMNIPSLPL
jgi:3-deoxy-D-manno-octulosonic-acid transferase